VPRELLEEQIYRYLCAQLSSHRLTVGTHLKANSIADDLHVSRTSVRKAILRLLEDGCVKLNESRRPIVIALPKKLRQDADPVFGYANQTEQAYWNAFERICQGKLREGQNVNGQELADTIGVSLGTVRQALDWLCRDGLLQRSPRHGWNVVQLDVNDMVDAFQIRLLLESEVISRAMDRLEPERLEQLIVENERVQSAGASLSEDERRRIDFRFHRTFLDACDSQILERTLDPLIRKCMLSGIAHDVSQPAIARTYGEHVEIAKALARKNLSRAQEVLHSHLACSRDLYERLRREQATHRSNGGSPSSR
jgi:DNA-binding GntR family transcriptional regulator